MKISTIIANQEYIFDTSKAQDISIPLIFNGSQPSTYGVEPAISTPYQEGDFIGDTRKGGGCNFEQIKITTHCNGTHTECLGHISNERISVLEQLKDSLIPAILISLTPVHAPQSNDNYKPTKTKDDFFISKSILEEKLADVPADFIKAVVIRTNPNDASKKSRDYMKHKPPFFSIEAMQYLVTLGVDHLLVDMPSVDRLFDEGKLNAHHIFWQLEEESHDTNHKSLFHKTITEMIYVKEHIEDGNYLLNLQIAPFHSDATPSRPLLYPIENTI